MWTFFFIGDTISPGHWPPAYLRSWVELQAGDCRQWKYFMWTSSAEICNAMRRLNRRWVGGIWEPGLRVRFFNKIQDWILKSKNGFCVSLLNRSIQHLSDHAWCILRTEMRIPVQSGLVGSLGVWWSEKSWIDMLSKEMQNQFSDSFRFKNPILDFLKNAL